MIEQDRDALVVKPTRWPRLRKFICLILGHDIHTFPASAVGGICLVYCLRCDHIWQVTDERGTMQELP
jgi:hypothetical protein